MCPPKVFRSVGSILFLVGYLTAGIMLIIVGVEYNKSDTSNDKLSTFFWIYAGAMLMGTVGSVLDNGDRFCGQTEEDEGKPREIDYFGGIFQVVAGFAWAGFGAGIAFFYADSQNFIAGTTGVNTVSADERENLAWLSGIAAIFYAFGSLFVLKELLCCEAFNCGLELILNLGNMVLMILLVIFWFLFADALGKQPFSNGNDDNRRNYAIALGVFYVIQGLEGILMFMLSCCFGNSPEPVEPVDPVQPIDPGYGDDTTTGYNNGQQGYNPGQDQGQGY